MAAQDGGQGLEAHAAEDAERHPVVERQIDRGVEQRVARLLQAVGLVEIGARIIATTAAQAEFARNPRLRDHVARRQPQRGVGGVGHPLAVVADARLRIARIGEFRPADGGAGIQRQPVQRRGPQIQLDALALGLAGIAQHLHADRPDIDLLVVGADPIDRRPAFQDAGQQGAAPAGLDVGRCLGFVGHGVGDAGHGVVEAPRLEAPADQRVEPVVRRHLPAEGQLGRDVAEAGVGGKAVAARRAAPVVDRRFLPRPAQAAGDIAVQHAGHQGEAGDGLHRTVLVGQGGGQAGSGPVIRLAGDDVQHAAMGAARRTASPAGRATAPPARRPPVPA